MSRREEQVVVSDSRSQQYKGTREERDLALLLTHGMLDPAQVARLREEDFVVPEYRRLVELSSIPPNDDIPVQQNLLLVGEQLVQDQACHESIAVLSRVLPASLCTVENDCLTLPLVLPVWT